jgi:PAS domain S-box-containing protein
MQIERAGRRLCTAGAVLGGLGLIGWLFGVARLTTFVPGQPPMMPNTAVSLVLIGIAGVLRWRPDVPRAASYASSAAAAVAMAIGVATLFEYVTGIELGIDQLLLESRAGPFPGRPSPVTAVALALLSAGVVLHGRPRARAALVLAGGVTALVGLMGHVFGAGLVYERTYAPVIGVALPTAIALLLITLGLLLGRPDVGLVRIATSASPGGVLFRRLVLLVMLVPPLAGLAIHKVFGLVGLHEDVALLGAAFVAVTSLLGVLLLQFVAIPLDRAHHELDLARTRARDLVQQASDALFVSDLEGRYTEVNDAGARLLGLSREQIIGKTIGDLLAPDEVGRLATVRDLLLAGETSVAEWHLRHANGNYVPVEVSAKILPDGRWQGLVRDITDRKAAEDAARRAQARIEGIISIAPDAIISIDDDQRITIFNQGAEDIFGWSSREVLGQPLDILLPERVRAIHRQHVARFAAGEATWRRLHRREPIFGLRKDGSEFPAEAAISKLRLDGGWTFTVVLRDITERMALERELRDAQSFLTSVLEGSAEHSIVALDDELRIALWNEGARRNYGYTSEEAIGRRVDLLHVQQDLESGMAGSLYARARAEGSAHATLRRRRKDGGEFLARVAVSRRMVDGQPVGLVVISRDITAEHQQAERERLLGELGSRLAALDRTQIVDGVAELLVRDFATACIVDLADEPPDGHHVRRWKVAHRDRTKLAFANACQELSIDMHEPGLAAATYRTRRPTVVTYLTPEYLDAIAQSDEHRRLLRELSPVSLIAVPLEIRGAFLGILTLTSCDPSCRFEDADVPFVSRIAERLASALENARLFEVASRAIAARDEVLGIVAHDLRSPLSAAALGASMLVRPEGERRLGTRRLAERIQRSLGRASRLIDDLLEVSRTEAGQPLVVEPTPTSCAAIASAISELLGATAQAAGLALDVTAPPGLPDVYADEARAVQALGNLVGNAVKFTPRGGRVTVDLARRDHVIEFAVTDTGPGIPTDQLPHLFDRFWQARRDRRGAGLGLAIAKAIVDAHGGRIWAESTPGHGSTFRFTLPVATTPARAASAS